MKTKAKIALLIFFASAAFAIAQTSSENSNLAPTPPMGWASWNHYFCDYAESTIRDQADALVSSGMRDAGYKYVLIQECIVPGRNADGALQPDPKKFPHGLKALVDYIHDRGLKAGIYTDLGPHTCAGKYEGSYQHEDMDAAQFAGWGFDLVEMDYCNKPLDHPGRELYERMSASIRKTGRPMLFYICSSGAEKPWEWAPGVAQLWRTDRDIRPEKDMAVWDVIVQNFEANARYAVFNSPMGWNDADMLEVGNHGATDEESRSQFLMWAISAAPLWASSDLAHMSDAIHAIYINKEVIAVDQDALGATAVKVQGGEPGLEVWSKPLGSKGSGEQAILLLNLSEKPREMHVSWDSLGLAPDVKVRDLLLHQDLGIQRDGYQAHVPAHGGVMLKITGKFLWERGVTYEAEWPENLRSGSTQLRECAECSSGYSVSLLEASGEMPPSILFTHVDVPAEGQYALQFGYMHVPYPSADIEIQIDDDTPIKLNLIARIVGQQTIPVHLRKGLNTIRVMNPSHHRVDIDMLHLAALTAQ